MKKADTKDQLHPRSRFRSRYDFARLVAANPALAGFVKTNAHGDAGIDYADPRAVKALNAALLADAYGLRGWDLPSGHLCPPIPGRSDYIHHLADLLELRRGAHRKAGEVALGRGEFAAGEQLGGVEVTGGIGTAGNGGKIEAEEHRITQQHHGGEPGKPARCGSGGGVRI